jgi:hypothetical protein
MGPRQTHAGKGFAERRHQMSSDFIVAFGLAAVPILMLLRLLVAAESSQVS